MSATPRLQLQAVDRTFELGSRPLLMGIVNASPDSFSDPAARLDLGERVELARSLLRDGADMIDVGGESAVTGRPPVPADLEIARVAPLVKRIAGELGAVVSVDTYKPPVARAAIEAGAVIVNDVSGLAHPELAAVCAGTGAALVVMHTRAAPKVRRHDPDLYEDVAGDVLAFLAERVAVAERAGVGRERMILDPGPDFAKTPGQTIELLRDLPRLHELGLPLLLAISRKDFIGALTGRRPRDRLAGTLAALAHGVSAGGHIFRVHDVAAAADYLRVRAALGGELDDLAGLALAEDLRHEPVRPGGGAPMY